MVSKITFEELCLGIKQSLNDVLGDKFLIHSSIEV